MYSLLSGTDSLYLVSLGSKSAPMMTLRPQDFLILGYSAYIYCQNSSVITSSMRAYGSSGPPHNLLALISRDWRSIFISMSCGASETWWSWLLWCSWQQLWCSWQWWSLSVEACDSDLWVDSSIYYINYFGSSIISSISSLWKVSSSTVQVREFNSKSSSTLAADGLKRRHSNFKWSRFGISISWMNWSWTWYCCSPGVLSCEDSSVVSSFLIWELI